MRLLIGRARRPGQGDRRAQGAAWPGPALGLGSRIRLPGGRGRLAPKSRAPEPPARREQRRGGRAAAPATYPAVRGGGRWARELRGPRGSERGLRARVREAGAPRVVRARRAGRLCASRRAFRAGPGKVGAALWPRGPGGKCSPGGRGPAREGGHAGTRTARREGRAFAGGAGWPGNPAGRRGRAGLFSAAAQGPGRELGGPSWRPGSPWGRS